MAEYRSSQVAPIKIKLGQITKMNEDFAMATIDFP